MHVISKATYWTRFFLEKQEGRASTGINITKDNKVLLQTKVAGEQTLPDTGYLPSARGTQRSPKNTRQRVCRVLHSANLLTANASLPSVFCRALDKEVAECPKNTRQTFFSKKK